MAVRVSVVVSVVLSSLKASEGLGLGGKEDDSVGEKATCFCVSHFGYRERGSC